LQLNHDELLSNFAFKFNLRRCNEEVEDAVEVLYADRADFVQHNSTTTVGFSNPRLKQRGAGSKPGASLYTRKRFSLSLSPSLSLSVLNLSRF